ncbi:MAG: hypothetical protein AB1432_05485 [Bacteroidota bacterium]
MRINGADLEFWFDGAEVPVVSADVNTDFDTEESTDTATPGTGKDYEVIRAARSLQIEANLYEPDGAEITSGPLTAGTRYRVTGGAINEGVNIYETGRIFESNGTGIATETNKVKPLGSKITGKEMALALNSVEVPVTDIDFNVTFSEIDVTDSATTGDSKEMEVTRADRETKVTCIVHHNVADLLTTSPVEQPADLDFSATIGVAGKIIATSKNIKNNTKEFSKVDYSFRWRGEPTETNLGLVAGSRKAIKVILKRGATMNKEYIGNAVITAKSAKANISGIATVSYTLSISGALAENVAN